MGYFLYDSPLKFPHILIMKQLSLFLSPVSKQDS